MSYTMYTPLNVWLDPASVTDVVAYIQTYLSENTIYSETEIETIIHDYLIAHPELIGGVQSVNGKTGTVVLSASDINTANNVTIESVLASLSSQISSIAASVATNTNNITNLTGRVSTAETDLANLKSNFLRKRTAKTDNFFSNLESEWKQGNPSNTAAYCASIIEPIEIEDTSKPLYVWQKSLYTFTAVLYIALYDSDDTLITERNFSNNGSYVFNNMSSIAPDAKYLRIYLHSGVGANHITPAVAANYFVGYVGYSKVNNESDYYDKYIQQYVQTALVEREEKAVDLINRLGQLETSSNWYSNNVDDWVQGEDGTGDYRSSMTKEFPVLKGNIYIATETTSMPSDLLTSGEVYLRLKNANDETLFTYTHNLSQTRTHILDTLSEYPTATKFTIHVTSGVGSVHVTPEIASALRVYVGYKPIASSITNTYNGLNHAVPQLSRDVVDGGYLPDYWLNYLHNKTVEIAEKDEIIGSHGISFAFVTDQHWNANYQKSPMILRWLKEHTNVSRFIGGGDILNNYSTTYEAMKWLRDWNLKTKGLHIRNIRGNHDNNSQGTSSSAYLNDDQLYSALIRDFENDITIETGKLYYYEKIESQKVCIFYLDTGDMVQPSLIDFDAQISWMSTIVSTLSSDWSILVIQHIYWDGEENGVPKQYGLGKKTKDYLDGVTNCNVIGIVCGHTHYDYDLTTDKGYKIICTTCDSAGSMPGDSYGRAEGTTTEQVVDVYQIDTTNKNIYVTRLGAGQDRQFTYA